MCLGRPAWTSIHSSAKLKTERYPLLVGQCKLLPDLPRLGSLSALAAFAVERRERAATDPAVLNLVETSWFGIRDGSDFSVHVFRPGETSATDGGRV